MKQVLINCASITTRQALHQALAQALAFPEWYGSNLDALHDCLTEISEDTELILENFQALKESLGSYAGTFMYVLHDTTEENPHFTCTLM